jgi:hypothetical protein
LENVKFIFFVLKFLGRYTTDEAKPASTLSNCTATCSIIIAIMETWPSIAVTRTVRFWRAVVSIAELFWSTTSWIDEY